MFVKISDLIGIGGFAKVYNVCAKSEINDVLDKNWFKLDNNLEGVDLNETVLKIGTIHDIECLFAKQSPKHDNIIKQFSQNEPTCDNSNRFLLIEKVKPCNEMTDKLTRDLLSKYIIDIHEGLKYLHEKGIVFCDLSLHNSGLGFDNKFKIFDFGSIKSLNKKCLNMRNTNKIFCSPYFHEHGYITPEELDDFFSLWYIFIRQCGFRLPWEYMSFQKSTSEEEIDYTIGFIKCQYYPNLNNDHKNFWKLNIPFENFLLNKKTK